MICKDRNTGKDFKCISVNSCYVRRTREEAAGQIASPHEATFDIFPSRGKLLTVCGGRENLTA